MSRSKASPTVKRRIAGRIQQAIEEHSGTNTAFHTKLDRLREEHSELHAKPTFHSNDSQKRRRHFASSFPQVQVASGTVRKWVPPPSLWRWDYEKQEWQTRNPRSAKLCSADWDAVQIPNAEQLALFCAFTGTCADWILGFPAPQYRVEGQLVTANPQGELELNVARFLCRRVASAHRIHPAVLVANGAAALEVLAAKAIRDFRRTEYRRRRFTVLATAAVGDAHADAVAAAVAEATRTEMTSFVDWRHLTSDPTVDAGFYESIREHARFARASSIDESS